MAIIRETIEGTKIINEIKSSNIKKTEYDTDSKLLIVEFNNNTKYQYEELPKTYSFVQQIGDMYWFLSGGVCGSWQVADACPEPVYTQFMQAFVDQTQISASDITLKCIVDTQEFLKNKNIFYGLIVIF